MGRMKMKKNGIKQSSIDWTVKVEKPEYELGETVRVFGHFYVDRIEKRDLTIHSLLKHNEIWNFPVGIIPVTIKLEPREEKEALIREFEVTNDYPPGSYNLKVGLEIEPKLMESKEVNFKIKGTLKSFDFQVILSRDREGIKKAKVFTSEDKEVFISLKSTLENVVVWGNCTSPDGKQVNLEFEKFVTKYKLSGIGVYHLEVSGRADGYRPVTKRLLFSVIKQPPRFNVKEY
jgi:hypothetical protein